MEENVAVKPPGPLNLLEARHHRISDLEALRQAAQLAIQVEFTTIPPYLTAMYSITDRTSAAYQALRSVVMEEMFHLNQAANLLVGIGGVPIFTDAAVPTYPAYLPSSNTARSPYIGLYRASPEVFSTVFMGIEMPAPFNAPPEGAHYNTIAQLYYALLDGIKACVAKYGESAVFAQRRGMRQRTDIYLGKFGGKPIVVDSVKRAEAAVQEIIRQGEGSVTAFGQLEAEQPFGAYHHYGDRTDGTYGPILGIPKEASHYVKFSRIANASSFPSTYPIVSTPRLSDYTNPAAQAAAQDFNHAYSVMLKSLQRSFVICKPGADPFFQVTLRLMHENMADLAYDLMTTPVDSKGNSEVGPNAAPTFEYIGDATLASVIEALKTRMSGAVPRAPLGAAAPSPETDEHRHRMNRLMHNFEELKRRADEAGLDL